MSKNKLEYVEFGRALYVKSDPYLSPDVMCMEIAVEKGFAVTSFKDGGDTESEWGPES